MVTLLSWCNSATHLLFMLDLLGYCTVRQIMIPDYDSAHLTMESQIVYTDLLFDILLIIYHNAKIRSTAKIVLRFTSLQIHFKYRSNNFKVDHTFVFKVCKKGDYFSESF